MTMAPHTKPPVDVVQETDLPLQDLETPFDPSDTSEFSYKKRTLINGITFLTSDLSALLLAMWLGGIVREILKGDAMIPAWSWLIIPVWTAGAFIMGLLPGWGLGPVDTLRRLCLLVMASYGIAAAALFLGRAGAVASRFTLTAAFFLSLPLVPLLRAGVQSWLIRKKRWGMPTAIYGSDDTAAHVLHALRSEPGLGYIPSGIFDDESAPGSYIEGIPVWGTMDEYSPDTPFAIVTTAQTSRERLLHMLEGPLAHYRRIAIIPDLLDAPSLWVTPRDFIGLVGLEITMKLLSPLALSFKRCMDFTSTLLTMPFWLLLSAVLALLIWLEDRKNPFFVQERIGHEGRRFNTWKFRTMHVDAEKRLADALAADPKLEAEWATDCKLREDPRVTRVGNFLRKTSLDELPQLWNVLLGDMSLVGPRPLPAYHYEQLSPRIRALRDRVRPGLSGLWQVSGRSESGTRGMERWDAYYVRNWSVWLDIVILVRTIRVVLTGQGAY